MCDVFCAPLRNYKIAITKVREEVAASQTLHYDIYVVLVLKNVVELDDARMLTDLEHFYLPLQQLKILQTQFFLLNDLNGALPPGAFVDRLFDKTVLTLS